MEDEGDENPIPKPDQGTIGLQDQISNFEKDISICYQRIITQTAYFKNKRSVSQNCQLTDMESLAKPTLKFDVKS